MDTKLLKELGFENAANKIDEVQTLKQKMALAYEHHRFIEPHILENFEKALREKTLKIVEVCPKCQNREIFRIVCSYCQQTGAREQTCDKLVLTPIKKYPEVPPMDCLMDLKKAKDLGCFDDFEVAKVQSVVERPDPIIFGLINRCADKFFITQWDKDVKIEDILKENEG